MKVVDLLLGHPYRTTAALSILAGILLGFFQDIIALKSIATPMLSLGIAATATALALKGLVLSSMGSPFLRAVAVAQEGGLNKFFGFFERATWASLVYTVLSVAMLGLAESPIAHKVRTCEWTLYLIPIAKWIFLTSLAAMFVTLTGCIRGFFVFTENLNDSYTKEAREQDEKLRAEARAASLDEATDKK